MRSSSASHFLGSRLRQKFQIVGEVVIALRGLEVASLADKSAHRVLDRVRLIGGHLVERRFLVSARKGSSA
jgi:hypothetical protein